MAASVTDKFTLASSGTRPTPTTLTATLASGSSPGTATCAALTGWPTATAVYFCIYTINTSGAKVAGSQTDWVGVVSGSTITGLVLKAGTNSGYSVGAVVEASPVAGWADALSAGLTAQHNQDGTHGAVTATSLTVSGTTTLTTPLATASVADAAITTRKLKPTTLQSAFVAQGGIFTTTSATNVDVSGMSMTYNSGSTAETLFLTLGAFVKNSGSTGLITLSVNGVDLTEYMPVQIQAQLVWQERTFITNVPASTAVVIKMRAQVPGANTLTISNDTTNFLPTIKGFAISQ